MATNRWNAIMVRSKLTSTVANIPVVEKLKNEVTLSQACRNLLFYVLRLQTGMHLSIDQY
ncbi:MAG: hypothetical protein M2R45_04396 [Verrucomicrobia subdivision 3 bacterium]|nr:hypothetical protein [Limisphaerales bacterium]MCS1417265.1 hypothetical protein [Limisphaerales bacterium]